VHNINSDIIPHSARRASRDEATARRAVALAQRAIIIPQLM
jgi:hypothetical protein